jgi:hypothetical protein
VTGICGVNQLPISELCKTSVMPIMIHGVDETKQHISGKYEKLLKSWQKKKPH